MAYTAYTTEKVFNDNSLNVAINALYDYLELHNLYSIEDLALSGNAALIVQGSLTAQSVRVIPFITSDKTLFSVLANQMKSLWNSARVITFKDRIQVVFNHIYFEIWLSDLTFNHLNLDGIVVQDADDIPNHLK